MKPGGVVLVGVGVLVGVFERVGVGVLVDKVVTVAVRVAVDGGVVVEGGVSPTWSVTGTVTGFSSGSLLVMTMLAVYVPAVRPVASKVMVMSWLPLAGTVPEVGASDNQGTSSWVEQSGDWPG